MGKDRSTDDRRALPLLLAPVAVVLGVLAMSAWMGVVGRRIGLRPALLVAETLLAVPALLMLALLRIPVRQALGLVPVPARVAALAAVAGVALWSLGIGVMQLQSAVWPPPPEYLEMFRRLHAALRPKDALDEVLSVLVIAVAPGLCEELLFRGAVLPALRPRFGTAGAVLVTAVLFGLIHVDWAGSGFVWLRVPFAVIVGIGFGALRVQSGSLLCPMLAHAVLNCLTFEASRLVADPEASADPQVALAAALLAVGLLGTAAVLRAIPDRR
jgi:membrane protease YdiL (CAAX protease family)